MPLVIVFAGSGGTSRETQGHVVGKCLDSGSLNPDPKPAVFSHAPEGMLGLSV